MPLGNIRNANSTGICLAPLTILNNCQKAAWTTLDKKVLGKRLEMIILRYEGLVGAVPPMTNYQAIANRCEKDPATRQPKIKPQDYPEIFEYIIKHCVQRTQLWFIPVLTNSDFRQADLEEFGISKDRIWTTSIKSVGMTSDKFGFYGYLDRMAGSGEAISEMVTSCEFGVTHRHNGVTDVEGVKNWSARKPQTDEELVLIEKGRQILTEMIKEDDPTSVDRVFSIPAQNLTQSIHIPEYDVFRQGTVQTFLHPLLEQIADSLYSGDLIPPNQFARLASQRLLPTTIDLGDDYSDEIQVSAQEVPQLASAEDIQDGYDATPVQDVEVVTTTPRRQRAAVR